MEHLQRHKGRRAFVRADMDNRLEGSPDSRQRSTIRIWWSTFGAPAVSADGLKLTDDDIAKLKAGKHTAGLVMHTMDAGWPHLQVAGITNTLKDYGIEVIGATDAKFNVGQQISDLEQMIARKPDVIFSVRRQMI